MAKVKGSRQDQLVIKSHRPVRGGVISFLWILVTAILMILAMFWGRHLEKRQQLLLPEERQQLSAAISKVAAMEQEQRVDRLALEESRQAIRALEEKIYALKKVVAFYRSIMEPEKGKLGLSIRDPELEVMSGGRVRLKWMLTQVSKKQPLISGKVEVRLLGAGGQEQTALSLKDLVGDALDSQFKFRYFQKYSVDFEVPDDLSIRQIEIIAQTEGKKVQKASRIIDWVEPERIADVAK